MLRGMFVCFLFLCAVLCLSLEMPARYAHAQAVITVMSLDSAGEGFNDPTIYTPEGGNNAATVGEARMNAFQHAADVWGTVLTSSVEIVIGAGFDPLTADCDTTSGVLGFAGPETAFANDPLYPPLIAGLPLPYTWYPVALANSLAGTDLDPPRNVCSVTTALSCTLHTDCPPGQYCERGDDIGATFNSAVGTPGCLTTLSWYYGLDGNPPAGTIDFTRTALHEIGHGLGFLTFVDLGTGAKPWGYDDSYMRHLEDHSLGLEYPAMTDAERVTASTDSGDLHWTGSKVVAAGGFLTGGRHVSGHVEMYAPEAAEPGSSVSHFSTTLSPNELMEPYHNNNAVMDLSIELMADLGWRLDVPLSSYALPDTGQTLCYDGLGNLRNGTGACPPPGDPSAQDGSYQINPASYTDNANGTVTDDNTGLMWQQVNSATSYNWFEATGTADLSANPDGAVDVCGDLFLGGFDDWRLPSRRELFGILDLGTDYPALFIPPFGCNGCALATTFEFWSTDEYLPDTEKAWTVDFLDGYSWETDKTISGGALVRCVRDTALQPGFFMDNGDGTVSDAITGLLWQQDDGGTMAWAQALAYCEGLDFAGVDDWRLPSVKELETIADLGRTDPAIDPLFSIGPEIGGGTFYWTSTTMNFLPDEAWTLEFTGIDGSVDTDLKTSTETYARCVREGSILCGTFAPCSAGEQPALVVGSTGYDTAQEALDAAVNLDTVRLWGKTVTGYEYVENLVLSFPTGAEVSLSGGWTCDFTSSCLFSIVRGSLTVTQGTLIVDGLVLK